MTIFEHLAFSTSFIWKFLKTGVRPEVNLQSPPAQGLGDFLGFWGLEILENSNKASWESTVACDFCPYKFHQNVSRGHLPRKFPDDGPDQNSILVGIYVFTKSLHKFGQNGGPGFSAKFQD